MKKAWIIYRQNEKLDSIRKTIEEQLKESEPEYDFIEDYDVVETKVFDKKTTASEIKKWASKQNLNDATLLLTDETFKRSVTGVNIETKIYSLDEIYRAGASEIDMGESVRRETAEKIEQEQKETDQIKNFAGAVNSFKPKPKKIYLAIPLITDHLFHQEYKKITKNTKPKEFPSKVKTQAGQNFLKNFRKGVSDEKWFKNEWYQGEKTSPIVAEKLARELIKKGFKVELVNEFISFEKMEENSLYLRDGHFTGNETVHPWANTDADPRDAKKEGTKARLCLDDLYYGAIKVGFLTINISKENQQKIFKERLNHNIIFAVHKIRNID